MLREHKTRTVCLANLINRIDARMSFHIGAKLEFFVTNTYQKLRNNE